MLAAPINELPDVVRDPQVRHNEMIVATEHATLGALEATGVPVKLRGTPGSVRRSAPVQGQHTRGDPRASSATDPRRSPALARDGAVQMGE